MRNKVTQLLPKLQIPTFSGKLTEWQSFWASFSNSVDNNDDYTDSQKLQLLNSYLDGDAKAQIAGYSITDASYKKAKDLLSSIFGDKQAILYEHVKMLSNLPPGSSADNCSKLFNEFNICFGNLLTLFDDNLESLRIHFCLHTQTVFSKLSFGLQSRLIRENGTKIKSDIVLLHTQLSQEAQVSRSLVRADPTSTDKRTGRIGERRADKPGTHNTFRPTVLVNSEIPTSPQPPRPLEDNSAFLPLEEMKCKFCDRAHKSSDCRTYPTTLRRNE